MLHKICDRLNSINKFSKRVITAGCMFSFILCMIGVSIIAYNEIYLCKVTLYNIGSSMIYTSIVTFAQFVIGGLLMDFFGTLLSER